MVLNADYQPLSYFPLSLWGWQDTVRAVFLDRVNIVAEYVRRVSSSNFSMKLPSVISLKKYKLADDKYFLVGFSQGTMLAIYTSLREKLLGVVGYSGAFLGNLPNEEIKNNDYLLLHGQNDTIVPIAKMHNAVEQLEPVAKTLSKKIYNDLEPVSYTHLTLPTSDLV